MKIILYYLDTLVNEKKHVFIVICFIIVTYRPMENFELWYVAIATFKCQISNRTTPKQT